MSKKKSFAVLFGLFVLAQSALAGLSIPPNPQVKPVVFYSTAPGRLAVDGAEGSPFSLGIRDSLKSVGSASLSEILTRITTQSSKRANQVPWFAGSLQEHPFCPEGTLHVHVIVNSKYQDSAISSLSGADAAVLEPAYRGACKNVELSVHKNLKLAQMQKVVEAASAARNPKDALIFHYSGNAVSNNASTFMLPVDVVKKDARTGIGAVSVEQVLTSLGSKCQGYCAVLVDACNGESAPTR
jgi:hypothetical protein